MVGMEGVSGKKAPFPRLQYFVAARAVHLQDKLTRVFAGGLGDLQEPLGRSIADQPLQLPRCPSPKAADVAVIQYYN
jgi:hypothetical protein